MAAHLDRVLAGGHVLRQAPVDRVELEEVSERLRVRDVIDGDDVARLIRGGFQAQKL